MTNVPAALAAPVLAADQPGGSVSATSAYWFHAIRGFWRHHFRGPLFVVTLFEYTSEYLANEIPIECRGAVGALSFDALKRVGIKDEE